MGRFGGFYGGCGPCATPFVGPCGLGNCGYNNNFYNNGYGGGCDKDYFQNGYGNRNTGVLCNQREVFYEKDNSYAANDAACFGGAEGGQVSNWDGGCNSGGCSSGGGFGGGCGPFFGGGCAPCVNPGWVGNPGFGWSGKNFRRNFGGPNCRLQKNLRFNRR